MQAVPLALQVGGSLVQGIGAKKAGNSQAAADNANAFAAENDGAAQAQQIRDAARLAMGQQVGAQAESGFAVGAGGALNSLRESAINSELDVLNIRRKAATQAAAYRQQAKQAKAQGTMGLVGSLFGAANAVATHFTDFAQAKSAAGYGGGGSVGKSSGSSGSGASKGG
jgi:hypothetical protein